MSELLPAPVGPKKQVVILLTMFWGSFFWMRVSFEEMELQSIF